jgi:murein DD-endopeptidase MepM/ murein hydrolase activator NlpD
LQVRRLSRPTAVLVTLAVGLAAAGAAESTSDLTEQLRGSRQELDGARQELEQTRERIGTVADQVRESDARLAEMTAELRALESRFAAAEAAVTAAEERTAEATARLAQVTDRLEQTRLRLEERETIFNDRVRAAFIYGNVTYAQALVGARDVADFLNTAHYVKSVMGADKTIIAEITEATAQLAEQRAEADALRDEVAAQQRAAAEAREEVAALTASQRRITAMVEEERAERSRLLAQLEVVEAATEEQIAELEAESAALEERLREAARQARFQAGAPGAGELVWPTSGRITSPYGERVHPIYGTRRMHTGIDISGGFGQPIVAAADGLVLAAYCTSGGYGCRVVIDHGGSLATLYAHMTSFSVGEGTIVTQGQTIGSVGSTGASTGPHLHFEVRVDGVPQDPMRWY